jgi:hypothetical protein
MSTHLKELLCHHKMKCVECIKEVHDKIITNSFFFHAFGPSVIDNPVSLLYCCVHMTYVLATRYLYSSTSSHHFIYVSMFRDRVLFPPFSLGQNSRFMLGSGLLSKQELLHTGSCGQSQFLKSCQSGLRVSSWSPKYEYNTST